MKCSASAGQGGTETATPDSRNSLGGRSGGSVKPAAGTQGLRRQIPSRANAPGGPYSTEPPALAAPRPSMLRKAGASAVMRRAWPRARRRLWPRCRARPPVRKQARSISRRGGPLPRCYVLDAADGDKGQADVAGHPVQIVQGNRSADVPFRPRGENRPHADVVRARGRGGAGLIRGMGGESDDHVRADQERARRGRGCPSGRHARRLLRRAGRYRHDRR